MTKQSANWTVGLNQADYLPLLLGQEREHVNHGLWYVDKHVIVGFDNKFGLAAVFCDPAQAQHCFQCQVLVDVRE